MNLNIVGHHINITPAVRQHIASKLNHVFEHFKYEHVVTATARLTTNSTKSKAPHQKAEVIVHVAGKHAGKGKDIVVETTDTNLYKAILIGSTDK
jgi:putative sigma-54 modulation protein